MSRLSSCTHPFLYHHIYPSTVSLFFIFFAPFSPVSLPSLPSHCNFGSSFISFFLYTAYFFCTLSFFSLASSGKRTQSCWHCLWCPIKGDNQGLWRGHCKQHWSTCHWTSSSGLAQQRNGISCQWSQISEVNTIFSFCSLPNMLSNLTVLFTTPTSNSISLFS